MKFKYLGFIISITLSQILSLSYASTNIGQEESQDERVVALPLLKRPITAPIITSEMAIRAYHSDSKTLEAERFTYDFVPQAASYGEAGYFPGFEGIVNRPVESINIVPTAKLTKSEEVVTGFHYDVQGEICSGFDLKITTVIKKDNLITAPIITSEMAIRAYHSDSKTLEAEGFTYDFVPQAASYGEAGYFPGFEGIVNRPVESINIVPTAKLTKSEEVVTGFHYDVQGEICSGFDLKIVETFPTLKELTLNSIVKNIEYKKEINQIMTQLPHDLRDSFYFSCKKIFR